MQSASSGSSSGAASFSTLRTSASAWATDGVPANAADAVTSRGRAESVLARTDAGKNRNAPANRERPIRSTASGS